MAFVTEVERKTKVAGRYDVIVAGGGPSGFLAALSAARRGARTLLIERYGFLGGTATNGLMVQFGAATDEFKRLVLGGATLEFLERMKADGAQERRPGRWNLSFDAESMIAICQEMVLESGVELLLHTQVVAPVMNRQRVRGVIVENKTGRSARLAKVVIDCTGDGDIAARAGAAFEYGRPGDGRVQPVSLEVLVGGVDVTLAPKDLRDTIPAIARARKRGLWPIPTERIFSWGQIPKRGAPQDPKNAVYVLNVTNCLGVNGALAEDLTRGEIETRRQVNPLVVFLRKNVPGFRNCYVLQTAPQIGVRETRRILGDYYLTRADVLEARHFDDGVVPARNSIDVHDVKGKDFAHEYLKPGTNYEIPYRCMLPRGLEGILTAGRCISCDHHALGSLRVMIICMPMGEAAGIAAALAADQGIAPRAVDAKKLRRILSKSGMRLGR